MAVLRVGANVKGAQARFDIGPFQLQPGEFAKLFLILVLSAYCAAHRDGMTPRRLVVALAICGVPMGLIMLQPDLGTNLVLVAASFTILLVAGVRARHLIVLLLLAGTLSVFAVQAGVLDQYQIDRLTNFANPSAEADRSGLQRQSSPRSRSATVV